MKLCLYFNIPAAYREAIYKKIDAEYDCDWYFDDTQNSIRQFDAKELNLKRKFQVKRIGPFYWVKGLVGLLFNKQYDKYLILAETRNLSLFVFLLIKCFLFRNKTVFCWTHGFYGKENPLEMILWKRPLFRMFDGIFCYGDYSKKLMIKEGFNEKNIYAIHNSLDYDRQLQIRECISPSTIYKEHFKNTDPIVVFIGRLTKVKRLEMLIEATKINQEKKCNYNLVFVGDGEMRSKLENMVKEYGLENRIWFYGACYDERTNAELLYNADLCVAPGNIGLTAIHALTFGCPCISHNNFEMQMPEFEAIQVGVTGNFFGYNDMDSLAQSIDNWFKKNASFRNEIRKNCYKEIDKNWNPYYQIKLIKEIIK